MSADLALGAQQLAAAGLEVLPLHSPTDEGCTCRDGADCSSRGKHPRTRRGLHDATDDPYLIAEWWRRWPRANVGLRVPAGMVVIDVDPRAGGDQTFAALVAELGPLPTTRVAETGGGTHVWLRVDGPVRGTLGPGVDVKSSSGYVLAPPSGNASGRAYAWSVPAPVAEAPETWAARLGGPGRRSRSRRLTVVG